MKNAEYWINKLGMNKHPEGGYFAEVFRSEGVIKKEHLPERYSGDRNYSTSIYFLITDREFSAFHRIKSDEIWHFYFGSPVTVHIIDKEGKYSVIKLGNDPEKGETIQAVFPAGIWFAGEVTEKDGYALFGCTVAPGFDYDDFELGKRGELAKEFPSMSEVITKLTR